MFVPAKQRLTGRRVNIDDMDPETLARLWAAQESKAIRWGLGITSAARTYAQQKHLYDGWRAGRPGFNFAANPDWKRPDGQGQGSRHQVQPDGFAYALDLRRPRALPWRIVHRLLRPFGLQFPLAHLKGKKKEDWHCQALRRFLAGKPMYYEIAPDRSAAVQRWRDTLKSHGDKPENALAEVGRFVASARQLVLRRGDKGPPVALMQKLLNKHNSGIPGHRSRWDTVTVDGDFGPATGRALTMFQIDAPGLTADGVCGPRTWAALLDDK